MFAKDGFPARDRADETTTLVAIVSYADVPFETNEVAQKTFRPLDVFTVTALDLLSRDLGGERRRAPRRTTPLNERRKPWGAEPRPIERHGVELEALHHA